MKNLKLLSIVAFWLISSMILSSCGITKNNDFSSQKYTNFRKGKTTAITNQAVKETRDGNLFSALSDKTKIANVAVVADDRTSQSDVTSKPEVKKESGKKVNNVTVISNETKKQKLTRSVSFVKDRLINKSNTTSTNDDGLSVLWVVVLVLLILWAVGLWGFNLGGLINILLVIALILLILWLLQVV